MNWEQGVSAATGSSASTILPKRRGILCSAIAFAGVPFAPHEHLPRMVTLFAVVLCPIVYGLIGAVGTLISVLLYNLASGWVGGLEADIR